VKVRLLSVAISSCFLVVVLSYADGRPTDKRQVKPVQPASLPAPAPPATLEQKPATPPQISFQGGQLTINAENSTLGDILKGVRTQTGAEVDIPGNATERVVGHFGPGPARDVLASLLYGSRFNYVLLGSPTDPSVLGRVILMAKSASAAEPEPASQENPAQPLAQNQPVRPVVAAATAADTEDEDDSDDADDSADDQTAQDDDQQQPGAAVGVDAAAQNGQQVVKTPEQLMQELQQRQQQIQQQAQQGANNGDGAVPNPPVGIAPRPLPGQEPH